MEEEPHMSSQSRRLVRRECGRFAVLSNSVVRQLTGEYKSLDNQ